MLPKLLVSIVIPNAVWRELSSAGAPDEVKKWVATDPGWVYIKSPTSIDDTIRLGIGEIEAISLAIAVEADLLLADDRKARIAAIDRGLTVAGTINVLEAAARRGIVDLARAFHSLQQTNFRITPALLTEILERNS